MKPHPRAELALAWLSIHRIGARWVIAVIASWVSLIAFAAITIPLKYPYEARGQLVDSGVVVGLVLPIAVMTVVLDEGPPHLVACASRNLFLPRVGLCVALVSTTSGLASLAAYAAGLPVSLVVADSALLVGLNILGAGLLGVRLGWALPAAVSFAASAPGLIPWEMNALYRVSVQLPYLIAVLLLAACACVALGHLGALGLSGRRQIHEQFEARTD